MIEGDSEGGDPRKDEGHYSWISSHPRGGSCIWSVVQRDEGKIDLTHKKGFTMKNISWGMLASPSWTHGRFYRAFVLIY